MMVFVLVISVFTLVATYLINLDKIYKKLSQFVTVYIGVLLIYGFFFSDNKEIFNNDNMLVSLMITTLLINCVYLIILSISTKGLNIIFKELIKKKESDEILELEQGMKEHIEEFNEIFGKITENEKK